jgi:hypothetical protein
MNMDYCSLASRIDPSIGLKAIGGPFLREERRWAYGVEKESPKWPHNKGKDVLASAGVNLIGCNGEPESAVTS